MANMIVSDLKTRLSKVIFIASTLAGCFFLITVFSMTSFILKTTEGFPVKVVEEDLKIARTLGMLSFISGIISLLVLISLGGWTKPKKNRTINNGRWNFDINFSFNFDVNMIKLEKTTPTYKRISHNKPLLKKPHHLIQNYLKPHF